MPSARSTSTTGWASLARDSSRRGVLENTRAAEGIQRGAARLPARGLTDVRGQRRLSRVSWNLRWRSPT
jgi:hypothetical protein